MNEDATFSLIGSLAIAIVMIGTAIAGRRESLPLNSFFGIRTNMTKQTEDTWNAAHLAAAPFSLFAAACFGLAGLVAAFVVDGPRAASIAIVVGWGLGLLATGASVYVAREAAIKVLEG